MKIGILQTGHMAEKIKADHGDYSDMFARMFGGYDFTFVIYNVVDMEFPATLDEVDGWLITGSRHGAYEDHPWIKPLEQLIRDIRDKGQPLVGICFGHQIIAQALGGRVEKFRDGWAVGRHVYDMAGTQVVLNAWHQDQVTTLPEGAEVLASSPFCDNAIISYGDRILTVQAHPEFDDGIVEGLIAHRGPGVVPDKLLDAARDGLNKPDNRPEIVQRLAGILQKGRVDA